MSNLEPGTWDWSWDLASEEKKTGEWIDVVTVSIRIEPSKTGGSYNQKPGPSSTLPVPVPALREYENKHGVVKRKEERGKRKKKLNWGGNKRRIRSRPKSSCAKLMADGFSGRSRVSAMVDLTLAWRELIEPCQ